jgi:hypothetical protein
LRFAAVGVVATIVHYSILVSLVELAHGPLIPSTSIGFVFGARSVTDSTGGSPSAIGLISVEGF